MRVPRARLQVFVPLDAFAADERERWSRYVEAHGGLTREAREALEDAYVRRVLADKIPADEPHALVRRQGRRVLVCPLALHERAAHAFDAFRRAVPDIVAETSVAARTIDVVLEPLSMGRRRPYVLEEPWAVPLPWLLPFAPEERRERRHPEGHGRRVVFLTRVDQARQRLDTAVDAVEDADAAVDGFAEGLAAVVTWLDGFPGDALVELDDGALAPAAAPDDAETDCADVWEIVQALASGDDVGARVEDLREKWGRRWALQHIN